MKYSSRSRGASSSRAGPEPDEADDLAVDQCDVEVVIRALAHPVRPEFGHAAGGEIGEGGLADQVVVGLVPALGVDAAECFGVDITNGADNCFGNCIGAHAGD